VTGAWLVTQALGSEIGIAAAVWAKNAQVRHQSRSDASPPPDYEVAPLASERT